MSRGARAVLIALCLLLVLQAVIGSTPFRVPGDSPPPLYAAAAPRTVNLTAVGDAYVLDAHPLRNFGSSPRLVVGRALANGSTYRSLALFDLSSVPYYAKVANAILKMHALSATSLGSVDVYRVRAPWTEGTGLEAYSANITVSETAGVARTREPVVVHVDIGGGGLPGIAKADFLLYDSLGREVPSQVYNVTTVNGKIVGVDLAFASTHAPLESKTYILWYGLSSASIPPYRSKVPTSAPLWTYAGGSAISAPAIADLNGDGRLEVVLATTSGQVIDLQWDGSALTTLWTYSVPTSIAFSPIVADLTGNGDLEVLFAVADLTTPYNHSVTAVSGAGRYLWHAGLGGQPPISFAASDTNGDGLLEIFVAPNTAVPTFYALRGSDGTATCTYTDPFAPGTVTGIALGDVTGSAAPEVVITDSQGHLRVRRPDCGQGTPGNAKPGAADILTLPTLANLTGSDLREILVGDRGMSSREFVVLGSDFATFATSPPMGSSLEAGQIVVDADRDGTPEVYFVTSGDGALRRATPTMNVTWTFLPAANGGGYGIPSAADIDGDGKPEILFGTDGTAASGATLYAVSHNGTEVVRRVLDPGVRLRGAPLAADLDGDGTFEIVVASDNSTDTSRVARVYAFGTGSLGHDIRASSYNIARTGLWLDGNSPDGEPLLRWTLAPADPPLVAGVTWATRDDTAPWANPGIDLDPAPLASAISAGGAWAAWNVTGLVQAWVNGSSPNTGFALKAPDESAPWNASFASREYAAAFAPVLEVTFTADPSPRILSTVPDQLRPEDSPAWTLDLRPYASDPDTPVTLLRWDLIGINASLAEILGRNVTGNHLLTFRPVPNAWGASQGVLVLRDDAGNFDTQPIRIELIPVNDAPKFNPPGVLYVRHDVPYTFDFEPYISDIDDPIASLALSANDTAHATVGGHWVTFLYPQDFVNRWAYVILTVSDPAASTASQVVAVKVSSDYPPQLRRGLPDVTLLEGETRVGVFDLDDYFSDPDADSLFFSYGNTHLAVTIHPDHTVDLSAPAEWTGMENITFRAEDPTGAIAEDTILATVVPVDDPPVLAPLPTFIVHYDYPFDFDLTPYVSDPDTPIDRLVVGTSNPSNVTVTGRVLTLLYPARLGPLTAPYTIPLAITVRDDTTAVSANTSVAVLDNFPPRLAKTLPDVSFPEDTTRVSAFDLDAYFLDIDGSVVGYAARSTNVRVTINPDHTVDLGATVNWSGRELVTFRAIDDQGALVEDSVNVVVTPVNDAPVLRPLPKQVHDGLGSWVVDLAPFLDDSDDPLSSLLVSTAGHPRVRAAGMLLVFDYGREAFHELVAVVVTDGELSAQAIVEVEVLVPSPFLPFLPVIAAAVIGASVFLAVRLLRTRIDEVFLATNSGLLVAHLSRTLTPDRDTDIVAGMFTAVQLFAKQSLASARAGEMIGLSVGGYRVTFVHGEIVYLTLLFQGVRRLAERHVQRKAETVLREVEDRFGDTLRNWSGMVDELTEIRSYLETFFGAKETGFVGIADVKEDRPSEGSLGKDPNTLADRREEGFP